MEGSPIPSSCDVAVDGHAQLGEGPRWDAAGGRLLWVDILGRKVHRYDPSRGRDDWVQLEQPVSAALPHDHGGPILALPDGLYETDWETLARIVALEEDLPTNRSNDAACDPAGRLWAGTMALDERTASAGLYRVGTDLKVQKAVDGTTVSNGLGWSPERDRFYFIDSPTMRIDVFDYDVRSGEIENRRQFATVQVDHGDAAPDGLAVDAEGCLWVALHGDWGLLRYSPDGALMGHVRLPVSRVTSCCFAGRDLDELYVTTRRQGLSDAELAEQPLAGALFRLDVGVAGLPSWSFAG